VDNTDTPAERQAMETATISVGSSLVMVAVQRDLVGGRVSYAAVVASTLLLGEIVG